MNKHKSKKPYKNRVHFLTSRQSLLDHLTETEKLLIPQVTTYKAKDPYYQKTLIEKYLSLQDDLLRLKKIATKSKEKANHIKSEESKWSSKQITDELRQLLAIFNNFLKDAGFIQTQ